MKKRETIGLVCVAGAYLLWGFLPLFWNLLAQVNPVAILAHRIIWSAVFLFLYMLLTRKLGELTPIFCDPKQLRLAFFCGVFITVNWGLYIYSINSGHLLDASMGYFIEPVLVALIGVVLFRERPRPLETVTFCFAAAGLLFLVVKAGAFPILALFIASSFAAYGALKKSSAVSAYASLFMETLWMTPFSLAFLVCAERGGFGCFSVLHGPILLLLPVSGIVTSVPLLLFNIGVKEIPYYFTGILMYLNPTIQFFMGLLLFRETLDPDRLIAFILIWTGILFTIADKVRVIRKERKEQKRKEKELPV